VRPYRVLLVNLARRYGGPETRVRSVAIALQGYVERCAVAVVAGGPLHERLRDDGIPCEPISATRTDPRVVLQLRRAIRRGAYDVVDAHNIQSIFWGHLAAVLAGARGRVSTLHSDYREEYSGIRQLAYPAVFGLVRPLTREFVQVTEQLQERAELEGHGARSTLIHNAVSIPDSPPTSRDAAVLAEWGWSAGDFVVAVIGRLFAVKGQSVLVEAMAELGDLPRVKLLIVGDGPQLAELEARVASLGIGQRVRLAGFRTDVPRVLQSVDCVCLPSLWELLPYAALEAAAFARPIVATAVGGVPRLLQDGETALLVPASDPRALAAAIRRLAEDPDLARRIGRAAYDMVRCSFSIDELRRRTLAVYDRAQKISSQ
jgi:glycosyltransferase involved in cell wall biosynthesis